MSLRGILSGALALIVLQVFTQDGPADKVSGLLGLVTTGVQKALSPDIAAIPDRSGGGSGPSVAPAFEVKPPAPTQNSTISPFLPA